MIGGRIFSMAGIATPIFILLAARRHVAVPGKSGLKLRVFP